MVPYMNHFNILQTISVLYFLFALICSGSSLSHNEECSALFQFKQSIIHQDKADCAASWFQTFDSWRPTSNASDSGFDCCSWYGVECSNRDVYGHVVGLDLSESSLCGHINSTSTLFSLVYLQSLNLALNDFYESQIPPKIACLKQLRSLNLSDSGFSGQIPNEISQLIQLSSLDLSHNPLKSPSGLKNLVQNLTQLKELSLSGVDIGSSVPHFLANFSFLRSINLRNCSLQNKFPVTIFKLPNLKFLDVAGNTNLTGSFLEFRNSSLLEHVDLSQTGFFGSLPESISNLNHLIYLHLTGCSFSGHIPRSLSNLTQLTFLALGSNKFTGFVPSLVSLSKLNVLELTGIKFENIHLPNWLGQLNELNKLLVYDMNIEGEISPFLANLTELRVLAMGNNFLIGRIPSWIFNLTQLGTLDLRNNQMQWPISSSLFSSLKSPLQNIHLGSNNISGRVSIDMFLGLKKLETFVLSDNKISLVVTINYTNTTLPRLKVLDLSTCNLNAFPAFLSFQNRIEALFLSNNKIDGMVPIWIWNNSKETLHVIDLSNNSITGFHKHPKFLQWGRLQVFSIRNNQVQGELPIPPETTIVYDFSVNNLIGELPAMICEVISLRILVLSYNNMSGTLPPCFGNLSNSLLILDLRDNNFHGIIMNAFMYGSMLRSIDLSKNGFTGQLPRSLKNCTNLEVLSLRDNYFYDVFPSWLGNLPNLEVLMLRSNKFYGPIQSSTVVRLQFSKLRILDLSNNGFSGQLDQKYFQTWNAIKSVSVGDSSFGTSSMSFEYFHINTTYSITLIHKGGSREYLPKILTIFKAIDLSCNHFEGEIPLSLQDLRGLESLNLSNNHFSGSVLPSLGYLYNLESLDLSKNDLSGEIPRQLLQLNFLSIFNVSFNHLHGSIPKGQQFNTFENDSYEGNIGLCGEPLSNECEGSNASTLTPISNTSESLLPSERNDWIFVFCGIGSGLIVGIVIGNFLYERYSDRFIKRKNRWVRPLRNTRRNQGRAMTSSSKGKEKV